MEETTFWLEVLENGDTAIFVRWPNGVEEHVGYKLGNSIQISQDRGFTMYAEDFQKMVNLVLKK